jgi:hypothetical protein
LSPTVAASMDSMLPVSASKTCLVRFDNNKYSVNASAVSRPVELHTYADRIVVRQYGRIVAEHRRSYGRPPPPTFKSKQAAHKSQFRVPIFDANPPAQRVKLHAGTHTAARRVLRMGRGDGDQAAGEIGAGSCVPLLRV